MTATSQSAAMTQSRGGKLTNVLAQRTWDLQDLALVLHEYDLIDTTTVAAATSYLRRHQPYPAPIKHRPKTWLSVDMLRWLEGGDRPESGWVPPSADPALRRAWARRFCGCQHSSTEVVSRNNRGGRA